MRSIAMPPIFHIAHLARYTPKFSRGTQKVDLVLMVWRPKSCNPDLCSEKAQFWIFFHENNFPGQTINFRLMTFPESYDLKGSFEVFWTPLSASCVPSGFSLRCGIDLTPSSETLSYLMWGSVRQTISSNIATIETFFSEVAIQLLAVIGQTLASSSGSFHHRHTYAAGHFFSFSWTTWADREY